MLSREVLQLINIDGISIDQRFLLKDLTLDWTLIDNIYKETGKNLHETNTCFDLKNLLNQVIVSTLSIIERHDMFSETLAKYSHWTCSPKQLEAVFCNFRSDPENFSLCGFLEVTTVLEYALGNVYQTCFKSQPPHLLKDLLSGLRSCYYFSENQIFILQILFTSKSSNLRNVSWHGFIENLHPAYLAFIFVIIVSYGRQLENQTLTPRRRTEIKLDCEICWPELNLREVLKAVPHNCHAWSQILDCNKRKMFSHGIYLILAQIEGFLRFIYSKINDEEMAVVAQLNKYYVIMDSIFYEYILTNDITPLVIGKITKIQEMEIRKTHQRNKMLEIIPQSIYLIYYDLFYSIDGPRLRDKLSHGEVIIAEDSSEEIFNTLINFAAVVVDFYNSQCQVAPENLFYESRFLGILNFIRNYNKTVQATENLFINLGIPQTLIEQEFLFKKLPSLYENNARIHFRPQVEVQIIKLMQKILFNFNDSIESFQRSLKELFQQYEQRKLSTSRRNMLENLIKFLPNFSNGFHELLLVLAIIFEILQKLNDKFDDKIWSKKAIKFLKQAQQITEIYQKHFSDKNRNFFLANSRTCDFLQVINDYKLFLKYEPLTS